MIENIMDDYRNTRDFVIRAIDLAADKSDARLEDDPAYVDDDDWED